MTRLSEAEDLGVGEDPEAELGNIKAFGERHPSDEQGAASRAELDGVLEDQARAGAGMVGQGTGRAKSGCERVGAGRVASSAELVDELGIWSRGIGGLGGGAPQLVPAGSREPLGELRCVLQRELARRKDVELCQVRLRALRDRIERAERLDLVAEELDARRLLR